MKRLIVFLILVCVLSVGVYAESAYVYDYADIYTDYEEAEIESAASELYGKEGVRCVILTDNGIGSVTDGDMALYADGAEDLLLLTIDMNSREFELYQYNDTGDSDEFKVSSSESDKILDSIYSDMAAGDYANAALTFLDASEEYYTNSDEGITVGKVLIYFLVGCAIGGIVVLIVKSTYKNKVHGATYPLSQYSKLELTASNDNFINKTVIVTHIPDPPSNSGKGGGGGVRMGGRKF